MQQTKKATMHPTSNNADVQGLKLVKNASIFQERGVYFIRHYSTIIFAYNQESKLCEVNMNCSTTSNRQIKSAIEFFDIASDKVVDVSDGSKWDYSGSYKN